MRIIGVMLLIACSIPGIRPEGRTQSVSATAPASRDLVYQRARGWFARNNYTVTSEVQGKSVNGFLVIRREQTVETRAVVRFEILRSSATETSYIVESRTERGTPPVFAIVAENAPEAEGAPESIASWLSCPYARWPACP